MKSGVRVAMALGTGYLLGRNHKMRLALALGAAAATGQLGKAPGQLAQKGTKALGSTPLGTLQEPGERLIEAGKSAAVAAVVGRINSLSDRLQGGPEEAVDRAKQAGGRGGDEDGADEEAPAPKRPARRQSARDTEQDAKAPDDDEPDDGEPEDEPDGGDGEEQDAEAPKTRGRGARR